MRSRPPPEKVLNRSRIPPRVWSYSVCRISGLTPGSGTKLRKRNTISAPIVNQIRWRSSVALEKLARLRLLAILSARDAMDGNSLAWPGGVPGPRLQVSPYRSGAGMQEPPPRKNLSLFGVVGLFRRDDGDRAAGLLDRRDRALRRAGDRELELGSQFALAQQ